jgi:hypothetical protein
MNRLKALPLIAVLAAIGPTRLMAQEQPFLAQIRIAQPLGELKDAGGRHSQGGGSVGYTFYTHPANSTNHLAAETTLWLQGDAFTGHPIYRPQVDSYVEDTAIGVSLTVYFRPTLRGFYIRAASSMDHIGIAETGSNAQAPQEYTRMGNTLSFGYRSPTGTSELELRYHTVALDAARNLRSLGLAYTLRF